MERLTERQFNNTNRLLLKNFALSSITNNILSMWMICRYINHSSGLREVDGPDANRYIDCLIWVYERTGVYVFFQVLKNEYYQNIAYNSKFIIKEHLGIPLDNFIDWYANPLNWKYSLTYIDNENEVDLLKSHFAIFEDHLIEINREFLIATSKKNIKNIFNRDDIMNTMRMDINLCEQNEFNLINYLFEIENKNIQTKDIKIKSVIQNEINKRETILKLYNTDLEDIKENHPFIVQNKYITKCECFNRELINDECGRILNLLIKFPKRWAKLYTDEIKNRFEIEGMSKRNFETERNVLVCKMSQTKICTNCLIMYKLYLKNSKRSKIKNSNARKTTR
jgi:hypothetical protein